PARRPCSTSVNPSPLPTIGNTAIAIVPKIVTIATAVATSSSSRSTTLSIAAIAEAPQIENPVPTSSDNPRETPSTRPSHTVPPKVTTTIANTDTIVPAPSPRTSPT